MGISFQLKNTFFTTHSRLIFIKNINKQLVIRNWMNVSKEAKEKSSFREFLTHDYTMQDLVGGKRYNEIKDTKTYRFFADWLGLGSNKIILGMYIDARAGLPVGTSLIARAIALSVHSVASPPYTWFREYVYRKGKITPEKSKIERFGAEFLAYNGVQTPLYVSQVAVALGIRSLLDSSVEFDPHAISASALSFFTNSWWLVIAGKWSMDGCRRFFGAKTPEQLAKEAKENEQPKRLENILDERKEHPQ